MKKIFAAFALFAAIFAAPNALAASEIDVLIDGTPVAFEAPPQIIGGRTMVPMRSIFEALGATVQWDGTARTVTAYSSCGCIIVLTIGSSTMLLNGEAVAMDVAPVLLSGHTYVPARFVAQALGYEVFWDAANTNVLINTDPFIRLDPRPVTLTEEGPTVNELGSWIIHYLHTGGVSELEHEIVRLVNIERAAVGAPPLRICPLLSAAARFKSQEMADLGYFSHTSPVFGNFYVIPSLLFGAEHIVSENLARRVEVSNMAESIVEGLMNSPGHRANKLNPNHEVIGVGVVMSFGAGVNFDGSPITNRNAALATQMFGYDPGFLGENPVLEQFKELFWMIAEGH